MRAANWSMLAPEALGLLVDTARSLVRGMFR